jgi:hypothetical protein
VLDLDETLIKATNDTTKLPNGMYDVMSILPIEELTIKEVIYIVIDWLMYVFYRFTYHLDHIYFRH